MSLATTTAEDKAPRLQCLDQCPLCGSTDSKVVHTEANTFSADDPFFGAYQAREVHLRKCGQCHFAFVDELPTDPEYYRRLYSYRYNWEEEAERHGKVLIFQQARRLILRYASSGQLFDVGAAMGAWMQFMADRFEVQGVEIHPGPAEFARGRGLAVACGNFLEATLPAGALTVITFIDVLEHLVEPARVIQKARDSLAQGGLIYIKVPNYAAQLWKQNWLRQLGLSDVGIMPNYAHINHFSPAVLKAYLARVGFKVLEAGFTPPVLWNPAPDVSLGFRSKCAAQNLVRQTVTALLNTAARVLGVESGLNLYVLARKRAT